MRFLFSSVLSISLFLSTSFSFIHSSFAHSSPQINLGNSPTWNNYPKELQQFDYSGNALQQHWKQLAAATNLPWPDAAFIQDIMTRFPILSMRLTELAQQDNSHPALKSATTGDYNALALAVQQVWRLHFQGQYEEAYALGLSIGPIGLSPALYSQLIYTTHLVPDPAEKERLLLEIDATIRSILPHAKSHRFILFADSYQKVRRLELMSTTAASSSGLIGATQKSLRHLTKVDPGNPLYGAMLAGIDAGIIERVGNFVGSMTYGADEDGAITLFKNALKTQPNLAVLYNEFAQAILRLNNNDYDKLLLSTLTKCAELPVLSAEEALNQLSCGINLKKLSAN